MECLCPASLGAHDRAGRFASVSLPGLRRGSRHRSHHVSAAQEIVRSSTFCSRARAARPSQTLHFVRAGLHSLIIDDYRILDSENCPVGGHVSQNMIWLDNPGCILNPGDLQQPNGLRTHGIMKPGLCMTVVPEGAGESCARPVVRVSPFEAPIRFGVGKKFQRPLPGISGTLRLVLTRFIATNVLKCFTFRFSRNKRRLSCSYSSMVDTVRTRMKSAAPVT